MKQNASSKFWVPRQPDRRQSVRSARAAWIALLSHVMACHSRQEWAEFGKKDQDKTDPHIQKGIRELLKNEPRLANFFGTYRERFARERRGEAETQQILLNREDLLRVVVDKWPTLVAHVDSNLRYHFYDKVHRQWLGAAVTQRNGKSMREVLGSKAYSAIKEYAELALAGEKTSFETRLALGGGRWRIVQIFFIPRRGVSGQPDGFLSLIKDITDTRQAEENLRESEERFRQLTENIQEIFWMSSPDGGQMLYISPTYENVWGRSCQSLYEEPQSWIEAVHPEERTGVLKAFKTKAPKGDFNEEFRIIKPDGSIRWIRNRAFPVKDSEGRIYRIAGIAEDVTVRKRAQDWLREYRLLVDSVENYAIFMLDHQGRVVSWNEGARRIKGYETWEIIGEDFSRFFSAEDLRAGKREQLCRKAGEEGRAEHEGWHLRKDGSKFWGHVTITALKDQPDCPHGYAVIVEDMTARKRMEEEIKKARNQEQKRIGRDLHDGFGQHLTGIAFMSRVLKEKLVQKAPEEAARAAQIEELINRAIAQTRDLAGRLYPAELETRDLPSILKELASSVEGQFGIACTFKNDDPSAAPGLAQAVHLYRIAQEAIRNAVQHGKAKHVIVTLENLDGLTTLRVEDDGVGFPDPLPVDKGGLGLSSMKSRAREIGASFDIRRGMTGGTVVLCAVNGGRQA